MAEYLEIQCPFCKEDGFDLYGLQIHLHLGWCPVYEYVNEDNTIRKQNENNKD